jgi:hypothetical protein
VQDGTALRQRPTIVEHHRGHLADRVDGAELGPGSVGGQLADLDAPMRDAKLRQQQPHLVDIARAQETVQRQHGGTP